MAVTVYRSRRRAETYVIAPTATPLDELPEALHRQMGELESFMEFELTPNRQLAQAEASAVFAAIERQGFYLQLPPSASTEQN